MNDFYIKKIKHCNKIIKLCKEGIERNTNKNFWEQKLSYYEEELNEVKQYLTINLLPLIEEKIKDLKRTQNTMQTDTYKNKIEEEIKELEIIKNLIK